MTIILYTTEGTPQRTVRDGGHLVPHSSTSTSNICPFSLVPTPPFFRLAGVWIGLEVQGNNNTVPGWVGFGISTQGAVLLLCVFEALGLPRQYPLDIWQAAPHEQHMTALT